jgi:(2Fe-2S) ferredoxin
VPTFVGIFFIKEADMPHYQYHIFICENERDSADPRGCCHQKGAPKIRARFKQRIEELGLHSLVRANSAGCLNTCANGPSVVIYPQGVWYGKVKIEDVEEIVQEHLLKNRVVTRLLMQG